MPRFLANENAPREAVLAARAAGFDVTWMVELQPGASDEVVLGLARQEGRVLITFDKDFGELVFRRKLPSTGVVLLRLHRLPLPDRLRWLQSRWTRILSYPPASFVVVTEYKIRVRSVRDDRA